MDSFCKRRLAVLMLVILIVIVAGYDIAIAPPNDFPAESIVNIEKGDSISDIANKLFTANIVAHRESFRFILRASGQSDRIQAGAYLFKTPENAITVAHRLIAGTYGIPPARITFPEGETVRDAAGRIAKVLPGISETDFISSAQTYEGYLFPDTYFFPPSFDIDSIIETMRANFDEKIKPLSDDIRSSGHSLSEIIIMASLVEREASTDADRRMIAGILWNRLALKMPLQVDAVFGYIYNRKTYSPSLSDLKVDSPYNTYTHIGLPPGPIANPGLQSIIAVLNPEKTDYLFYLTGKDGLMHYAKTYSGHQANRKKYLD